jgi:hypothetical protein
MTRMFATRRWTLLTTVSLLFAACTRTEDWRVDSTPVVGELDDDSEKTTIVADQGAAVRCCPVHQELLKEERAAIVYGTMAGDYMEARRQFPFANDPPLGGCVRFVGHSPTHAIVNYCDECRAGWQTWLNEYYPR